MKIAVPFLVSKPGAHGRMRHYWQPSAHLKAAGWTALNLGPSLDAAVKAAQARNAEVELWRAGGGGGAPGSVAKVARLTARGTVGAGIAAFRAARFAGKDGNRPLGPKTQKTYATALDKIDRWAGDAPIASITRARVKALKLALLQPDTKGGPVQLHRAHATLRVGRTLFQFFVDEDMLAANPFTDPGLEAPPPRHHVASPPARAALFAAAQAPVVANGVEYPADISVGLAVVLGFHTAQREGDLLKLSIGQWVELSPEIVGDPLVYGQLARLNADGRVMGIRLRQGKTARWIGVPVVGEPRRQVEAAIARSRAAGCTTILLDERTKRPWSGTSGETRFQRRFADVRARAVAVAHKAADLDLAAELAVLQFRDFRRTAVVYYGELGLPDHLIAAITGHKLEATKKILETYMPRTTAMAARGIALSHRDDRGDHVGDGRIG